MEIIIREAKANEYDIADNLLTLLIEDECQYDNNLVTNFKVKDFYKYMAIKKGHYLFVATYKDEIVGYIYGYLKDNDNLEENRIAMIDALYVIKEYRGHHIAKDLINYFVNHVKNVTKNIEINVMAQNKIARNLYYKLGFIDKKITLNKEIK